MKRYSVLPHVLNKYRLIYLPLLSLFGTASAQVIYTDVSPNYEGAGNDIFGLDLNNDGIFDFNFIHEAVITTDYWGNSFSKWSYTYRRYTLVVTGLNNNEVVEGIGGPDTLNLGTCIHPGLGFNNYGLLYSEILTTSNSETYNGDFWINTDKEKDGLWYKVKNKYLGLKVDINGEKYYGWVRLSCHLTSPMHYLVKDYAFNTVAGEPIVAGEMISCVFSNDNFSIVEEDKVKWVIIKKLLTVEVLDKVLKRTEVIICNIKGQKIASAVIEDQFIQIDLSGFNTGLYVLVFSNHEFHKSYEFFIE